MINEAIRHHFGVQLRPLDKPIYRKSYPDWVDEIPLPRGYKTPDLSTFSGEDGKSTMEHVRCFMAQYGEANQDEYHKLQLFPLSLTGTAFSCYSALAPNSVQSWAYMERLFHDHFYKPQPKVSITKLMTLRQLPNEHVADFLERFRRVRS